MKSMRNLMDIILLKESNYPDNFDQERFDNRWGDSDTDWDEIASEADYLVNYHKKMNHSPDEIAGVIEEIVSELRNHFDSEDGYGIGPDELEVMVKEKWGHLEEFASVGGTSSGGVATGAAVGGKKRKQGSLLR